MKPQMASSMTPEFRLPDVSVPGLEFAGISAQYAVLAPEIAPRMAAVLEHGRFIMGPEVAELETELARFCGAKYAIAVSSGTDALVAALMAYGVGPGDAVFVPSFTFTASAEVILLLGATPVFVDVDGRSFNIDVADLERRIDSVKKDGSLRPKAIIAVDLFGLPADYGALNSLAEREDLVVIADAAQSFGSIRHGRKAGTMAPATATSFFPAKPLGCYGDGGAIFTDDAELDGRLRSIRVHGQGLVKYEVVRVGLNARLDTLQAAVLLGKLPAFAAEIEARNALADFYDNELRDVAVPPKRFEGHVSAWAQYSILIEDRDGVQTRLKEAGVPTAVYYPLPMHLQPAYAQFGSGAGSLPVCEELCGRILSLPMHGYMKPEASELVAGAVRTAAGG